MRNIENVKKTYDYFLRNGKVLNIISKNFDLDNESTILIKCDKLTMQFELKNGTIINARKV